MRQVGVREFKNQATALLAADEPLTIERHGEPIGFYIPIGSIDPARRNDALRRLGGDVDRTLERLGISEDDLVEEIAAPSAAARGRAGRARPPA